MKKIFLLFLLNITGVVFLYGQHTMPSPKQLKDISLLIDKYSEAREKRDTVLLKSILTSDVDQLVSTGEWRTGINASVKGMLRSSASSPGTRTLNIEKTRLLNANCAIVDCKYEIQNADGTPRKMWSTFVVVSDKGVWKISAIRNMLPTGQ
jgi:ketosteroid isomerase-like protein